MTYRSDDALRPEETVAERVAWAWGIDTKSEAMMEAVDYRGQESAAVVEDVLVALGLPPDPFHDKSS